MASTRYEYILSLNDKMSGALKRAGVSGGETYNKLQAQQEKLNRTADNFRDTLLKLGVGFGALQLSKGIVKAGVDMEQTRVSFGVLLQDLDKGNKLIGELNNFANVTPFDNEETIKAGKLMLGAQIPAEKVVGTLRMIGDVAAGANVPLTDMAAIYAKAMNKGRVQAEELNQMAERGVPIIATFAKMYGVTTAEVMKMGEQGKLSSGELAKAFDIMTSQGGIYFNMIQKQSQTAGGKWSTFLGNLQLLGITFGEKLLGSINGVVDKLIVMVDWANRNSDILFHLGKAALYVAGTIGIFKAVTLAQIAVSKIALLWQAMQLISINVLGDAFLTASVGQKLFAAGQWLVNAAMSANPIGLIVVGIAALVALIYKAVKAYDKWGASLLFLMGPLGMIVNAIMALRNNWESITKAFKDGGIIGGLKRIGIVLLDTILYPIQQLLGMLSKIPGLGNLAGKGEGKIAELRKSLNLITPESKEDRTKASEASGALGSNPAIQSETGLASASVMDTAKGIADGGSRPTNINITLGNLVETLTITPASMKEGVSDMERMVREALLRVLNSANGVAYGN